MSNNITLQKVKRFGTYIESTLSIGMVWLWLWRFLSSNFCLLKNNFRVNTFIYLEYSTFSSTPYRAITIPHHTDQSPYIAIHHHISLHHTITFMEHKSKDNTRCIRRLYMHKSILNSRVYKLF